MDRGYVRLWRKTLDSEIMTDDWLCRLWMWCMMKANHQTGKHKGVDVAPGEFVTGTASGAELLSVSPSKFRRGLAKLADIGNIIVTSETKFTKVTLCNWEVYNSDSTKSDFVMTRTRRVSEHKQALKNESTLFPPSEESAPLAEAGSPQPPSPSNGTRPRDELFDTIARLTGSDPHVSGPHIGRVRKALLSAKPPYTCDDLLRLPDALEASGMRSFKITLGSIEKYIGLTRNQAVQTKEKANGATKPKTRNMLYDPASNPSLAFGQHDQTSQGGSRSAG